MRVDGEEGTYVSLTMMGEREEMYGSAQGRRLISCQR